MSINLNKVGLRGEEKIIKLSTISPIFCYNDERIKDVVEKIVRTGYRRIPIISKSKELVGVLTKTDVLGTFLRREDFEEKVSTIMNRNLITCDENDSIEYALSKFKISRRGGFPVVSGKKIVGMVSERDFIKRLSGVNTEVKVQEAMTTKPFFIRPEISIMDCLRTMVNAKYRRLPVVDGETLIGIVTAEDLLKYLHEKKFEFDSLDEGIENVMIRDVMTIEEDADLGTAAEKMFSNQIGDLLVTDENNRIRGIITERDILEELEFK